MAAGGIPPNANKAGGVTDRRDFEASFRYAPFGFKIFPHLRIHYFGCFPTALFLTFPDSVPQQVHMKNCVVRLHELPKTDAIRFYLCPERKISFDGFVNYEGRRFGVPYSYSGKTARISRSGDTLYIYSADLRLLLVTHNVTWSRKDSFCEGQYEDLTQPEEFPTMPVKTQILRLPKSQSNLSFAKFDFDEEDPV